MPDHPLLAGLGSDHLHDWRGEATLLPPRLDYEMRPDVRPDGPLVRHPRDARLAVRQPRQRGLGPDREARPRRLPAASSTAASASSTARCWSTARAGAWILFCQLDVTGRTEPDPAADTLVHNLLRYAVELERPPCPAGRAVVYAGEPAGLAHLESAGISAIPYDGGKLATDQVLVVGPGGGPDPRGRRPAHRRLARRRADICWPSASTRPSSTPSCPRSPHPKAEHIAAFFEPPPAGSPLAGVGPADVHNRDPRDLPLVTRRGRHPRRRRPGRPPRLATSSSASSCPGSSTTPASRTSSGPSAAPRSWSPACSPTWAPPSETPLLDRFATPVAAAGSEPRWKTGLYLDQPEEWDDPYRFFRW